MKWPALDVVLKAVRDLKPDFRFDNVDVLADPKILLSVWKSVNRRYNYSWRTPLRLINNTLVLGPLDAATPDKSMTASYSPHVHQACVFPPSDPEKHQRHWKLISYKLGKINCLTTARFDAVVSPEKKCVALVRQGKTHKKVPESFDTTAQAWLNGWENSFSWSVNEETRECDDIQYIDWSERVASWKATPEAQVSLGRFARFLSELQRVMKAGAADGRRCVLFIDGGSSRKKPLASVFPASGDPYHPLTDLELQSWSDWSKEALRSD